MTSSYSNQCLFLSFSEIPILTLFLMPKVKMTKFSLRAVNIELRCALGAVIRTDDYGKSPGKSFSIPLYVTRHS